MTKEVIFKFILKSIQEVIPNLSQSSILPTDSLKALGANSIDRAEILMLTMAQLKIKAPLAQFASAENIQGIVDIFQHYS